MLGGDVGAVGGADGAPHAANNKADNIAIIISFIFIIGSPFIPIISHDIQGINQTLAGVEVFQ
jgi:hypothetical protein